MLTSNLPLIFMDGYPAALDKMSNDKLEIFISFLVRCSLGHDTAKEINVPLWWPRNIPFTNPFRKLKTFKFSSSKWREILLQIILRCYRFHQQEQMLGFSMQLASIPHEYFRVVENSWNGTTSFLEKKSNKLIVTVRNELLTYDRLKNQLKQSTKLVGNIETVILDDEVYSCPNCFFNFDSLNAFQCHERTCLPVTMDDDPLLTNSKQQISAIEKIDLVDDDEEQFSSTEQSDFLKYFKLSNCNSNSNHCESTSNSSSLSLNLLNRRELSLLRCPTIDFSSPLGQYIFKKSNRELTQDNITERLNRVERFTSTKIALNKQRSTDHMNMNNAVQPTTARSLGINFPIKYKRKSKTPYAPIRKHIFNANVKPVNLVKHLSIQSQLLYKIYCRDCYVKLDNSYKLKVNSLIDSFNNNNEIIEILDSDEDENEDDDDDDADVDELSNHNQQLMLNDNSGLDTPNVDEREFTFNVNDINMEYENCDPLEEFGSLKTTEHCVPQLNNLNDVKRRLFCPIQFSNDIPNQVIYVD